jgi:hypothetical protein
VNCLWEVENGYMGESYMRCYAWAATEEEALRLAREQFQQAPQGRSDGEEYWSDLSARCLFPADAKPFVTKPSGSGWER